MKRCCICKVEKSYACFNKQASRMDGYASRCRDCSKAKKQEYYLLNREVILKKVEAYRKANPEKAAASKKASRLKKIEEYSAKGSKKYAENRKEVLAYQAEYRERNKDRINARNVEYVRRRLARDDTFKLSYAIRCRLGQAFRKMCVPKRGKTREMVGCDWSELKAYIEGQLQKGMSWDNRGAWHIDHKIPLSSARSVEEMERLCHYTNLQPLWAADNLRKGARMAA